MLYARRQVQAKYTALKGMFGLGSIDKSEILNAMCRCICVQTKTINCITEFPLKFANIKKLWFSKG